MWASAGVCGCFSAGSYHWARNLWVLIIYLFFLPVMLPSEVPRLATESPVRVFPGIWKLLFFKTPFLGWISILISFVALFIFYIFSYHLLKTMGCFSGCLMSSASIQKLFCEIYSAFKCFFNEFVAEKVVSPSYSSAILGLPYSLSLSYHWLRTAWFWSIKGPQQVASRTGIWYTRHFGQSDSGPIEVGTYWGR